MTGAPTDKLPRGFYEGDPIHVARRMLGVLLVHAHPERGAIVGRIVETEAYRGEEDRACHACRGLTRRTRVMYGPPGRAYVYLIYGMYNMLNAVVWPEGRPSAVLVRAVEPVWGIERTTNGPGRLTLAMGIDRSLNAVDLTGDRLWLSPDRGYGDHEVDVTPRIGVDYAGEWASRPWRFVVRDSPHRSR